MFEQINEMVSLIKQQKPLVLNITNDVTMDFIANGLLSLGASPIMSQAEQEIEELLTYAHCVVINIGTLNKEFVSLCQQTCRLANQLNKPIVLDPVGAGATQYRKDTCLALLTEYNIAMIRANASEVMALADASHPSHPTHPTKGVDSTSGTQDAVESAKVLSKQYDAAVIVSGEIDWVIDQDQITQLQCGSPLMPTITGTGCLLSAMVGAFHAVEKNRFIAAKSATLFYGKCGELAAEQTNTPGMFRAKFLDALHFHPERSHYEKQQ